MRDEKEERKKQARSNKQTRQSNTAHPRQSLFREKMNMYMYVFVHLLYVTLMLFLMYMYMYIALHHVHVHVYCILCTTVEWRADGEASLAASAASRLSAGRSDWRQHLEGTHWHHGYWKG